jgi:hypothetical protein
VPETVSVLHNIYRQNNTVFSPCSLLTCFGNVSQALRSSLVSYYLPAYLFIYLFDVAVNSSFCRPCHDLCRIREEVFVS